MKKISFLLLALFSMVLTSCHDGDEPSPIPENWSGRTVLVYMVAENSLGYYGCHKSDSTEIMNGRQYVKDTDRMLFFIDGGGKPTLYRCRADRDEPEVIMQWDKDFCSANPDRLQEVLDTVKSQCPAREYGLVLWSHSDGWISPTDTSYSTYESQKKTSAAATASAFSPLSFGIDSGPDRNYSNIGAQMRVEDIATVLGNLQMHPKYIFFDSCLMGNVEVAYALRNVTDYLVAAPIATPGAGSYYTHELKKGFFSDDPSNICATYIEDVQSDELKASYTGFGLAISCVRTDQLESLAASVKQALPYSTIMNRQSADMDTVLAYQAYSGAYYYRPHNYDALQALRNILPAAQFQNVERCLRSAVVYYDATPNVWIGPSLGAYIHPPLETNNFCALSLFIPQDIYTKNARISRHGNLNTDFQKTEWYEAAGFAQTGW